MTGNVLPPPPTDEAGAHDETREPPTVTTTAHEAGTLPGAPPVTGLRESSGTRALLVAVLAAAGLAAGAASGQVALTVAIAVVQVALIFGWVLGTSMPGRIGGLLIALGGAAAADVVVLVWPRSALSPLLPVLGVAIPALFVHQLTRGVVRARVVESLSDIVLVLLAVVALPAYLQLEHEFQGSLLASGALLAGGTAVAVGYLADLVWSRPRFDPAVPRGLTAAVLSVIAGAAAGAIRLRDVLTVDATHAVLLAAGIAALSALVAVAVSFMIIQAPSATSGRSSRAALLTPLPAALLPFAFVAPAAYVICLSVG